MKVTSGDLLEFDALKGLLRRYVSSPLGEAELEAAEPSTDRAALEEAFAGLAEAVEHERALERPQPAARGSAIRVKFSGLPDCGEALAKLRIEGAVLDGAEILELKRLMEKAGEIRTALVFSEEAYPRLAAHARRIADFRPLVRELTGKLLPDGSLADSASVALGRLRREVEHQKRRIQESLENFLRRHREEGILQEEFVTIRNDRYVVPIVSGQQRRVEGVIHGASGTGHTLFIEPFETIELNNELVRLTEEVFREEHRILREMTEKLRAAAPEIEAARRACGELDYLFARARFALEFGAVIPRFSPPERPRLCLREARHPLLEDVLRRQGKPIVPISFDLDGEDRTLLISGPNTGGKTVTLKTAGLLALMAQAGLPVPSAEAEFPLFDEVLADIGDQQSIEESLSTFSAHIARIREMLAEVSPRSLVLLDELGRATDPGEGGALAVAVVDEFRRAGAFTLASTHLLALKVYGATTPGVLNASMGFDEETLEPTYRLRVGAPGKSAGLEIARRLGLPERLIERARENLSAGERDLARFIDELREKLDRVAQLEAELEERRRELAAKEERLAAEWRRRETARLAGIERRAEEAIRRFEAAAEETIARIEREAAERKAAAAARKQVARAKREFRESLEPLMERTGEGRPAPGRLVEGAVVRIRGVRQPARVRRFLDEDRIEVEAGLLKLHVSREDVVEILPQQETGARLPRNVTLKAGPRAYVTTREVNVIGLHAEEARERVDKFIDSAVLASVDRVRIIHGHGMGILRKAIAELLTGHPHVERFYPASPSEGGSGATIAELKD